MITWEKHISILNDFCSLILTYSIRTWKTYFDFEDFHDSCYFLSRCVCAAIQLQKQIHYYISHIHAGTFPCGKLAVGIVPM